MNNPNRLAGYRGFPIYQKEKDPLHFFIDFQKLNDVTAQD